jgi:O-antigen/teichoic acid export membrane protein
MFRNMIGKWVGRSTWALLDQGLFAASNFALNIVFARWLGADAYGAFAIAFTVFLFVGVVHSGLLTEPMLVFGAGRYRDGSSGYFSSLLKLHWTWGWAVAGGLTALAAIPFWGTPSRGPILALAVLTGLLLYLWLLRRACYLPTRPRFAAEGGALYLVLMVGGITGLQHTDRLSAVGGLMVMGGASLAAGMFLQQRITRARSSPTDRHRFAGKSSVSIGVTGNGLS